MQKDNGIIEIEEGSEAFYELRVALANPNIYKISFQIRGDKIAIKSNEAAWTHSLDTTAR